MISRHMDIQTVLRLEIVSTYVTSVQKTIGVVLGLNMVSDTVPGGMFKEVTDPTDMALIITRHHIHHQLRGVPVL